MHTTLEWQSYTCAYMVDNSKPLYGGIAIATNVLSLPKINLILCDKLFLSYTMSERGGRERERPADNVISNIACCPREVTYLLIW